LNFQGGVFFLILSHNTGALQMPVESLTGRLVMFSILQGFSAFHIYPGIIFPAH